MKNIGTRMTGLYQRLWKMVIARIWQVVVIIAVVGIVIFLVRLFVVSGKHFRVGGERVSRGPFHNLLKALARLGVRRRLGETPREYALSLGKLQSGIPNISKAVKLFYAWRYGGHDTLNALDAEVTSLLARLPKRMYPVIEGKQPERSIAIDERRNGS